MTNVVERVWTAAQQHSDREAIVAAGARFTYREFAGLVRGVQNKLLESKSSTRLSRVGIMTDDSAYSYAAIVAVMALGAAYVPLNSKNPPLRNIDVIRRAEVGVVIVHNDDLYESLSFGGANLPDFINARNCARDDQPWTLESVSDDALAYIMFTSGSTGHPKGVTITHGNLLAFINATFGAAGPYDVKPTDRFLQMFELTFDLSVMCYLIPLSHGATTCIVPEQGIGFMNVAQTLENEAVSVALMVPSILSYMKRFMPELSFPSVRLSLFCGEALPHDLLLQWSQCVPNAIIENTYGPTEATIFCSRFPYTDLSESEDIFQGVVSIGRAIADVELFILGDDNNVQAPGERGELCIAGPQVMSGYWNDPDKSKKVLSKLSIGSRSICVYRTGDIAYANERGNLIFCGRKDFQVKIDGHRVELGEIEHQAREFLGHSMVAAMLGDDQLGQKELVLFAENGANQDADDLSAYLAERLPIYMRPSRIEFLTEMPLNLNGKIDRPAIRQSR